METLEDRILIKLLLFCQKSGVIGAYRVENESVHIYRAAEYYPCTHLAAVKYLIRILDEEGLANSFSEALSKSAVQLPPDQLRRNQG